jgi:hypothetical protein
VRCFKRIHNARTKAEVTQHSNIWCIQISLRGRKNNPTTITGYVPQSLALAKELADKEILKYGHVCKRSCRDWIEVR